MGGIGSGTYRKYKSRPTTADYFALDLRKLNKLLTLNHTCGFTLEWCVNKAVESSVQCIYANEILEVHYTLTKGTIKTSRIDYISLISTPCNFGGNRQWLVCPQCNSKKLILYVVDRFKCRKCHRLYHPSSNEGDLYRATRAMSNYQDKLNGQHLRPMDGIDGISKPKWMRYKTYERLKAEANLAVKKYDGHYGRVFNTYMRSL